MDTGIEVLEAWLPDATQAERAAVYAALFAMADRTLLRTHRVIDDPVELSEFFVLLEGDLVVKMRMHSFESFGLVYLGPSSGAPGRRGHGTGLAA
jgi:hypothetical protein